MRAFTLIVALSTASIGCGHDDEGDEDIMRLDEASEEVAVTVLDRVDRGDAEEDPDAAAHLVSPGAGESVPAGAPVTLEWEPAQSALRHGRTTGDFVVLRITCDGVTDPLVVVAIESTEWTCDQEHWDEIVEAGGGPCAVEVVSAYVSDGVIEEGPFVPVAAGDEPTFQVE